MKAIRTFITIIQDLINFKKGKTFNFYLAFDDHHSNKRLQFFLFGRYKDSSKFHRNIVAGITKNSRKEFSFTPNKDWKRYEIEYNKYLEMEGSFKSYEEIKAYRYSDSDTYVVKFREGGYHPGDRYAEYTSGAWSCWMDKDKSFTAKIKHSDDDADWTYLETIDDSTYASIDRDCWTAYRYATKVEIEKYKIDRKEYKDMEIEKTTLYNDYQEKRQVLIKKMESIIK